MQKIGLIFKGEGSLTLNVVGCESISLKKEIPHVFSNAADFKAYSKAAADLKNAGILDIVIGDVEVAPVAPPPQEPSPAPVVAPPAPRRGRAPKEVKEEVKE